MMLTLEGLHVEMLPEAEPECVVNLEESTNDRISQLLMDHPGCVMSNDGFEAMRLYHHFNARSCNSSRRISSITLIRSIVLPSVLDVWVT